MRDERVGCVLDRYERALSAHWAQVEEEADRGFLGELLVRLASPVAAVRYLALGPWRIGRRSCGPSESFCAATRSTTGRPGWSRAFR